MNRVVRRDVKLDQLSDERDHVAIQLSLVLHCEPVDLVRVSALQRKLKSLESEIVRYKPEEAEKLHRNRMGPST